MPKQIAASDWRGRRFVAACDRKDQPRSGRTATIAAEMCECSAPDHNRRGNADHLVFLPDFAPILIAATTWAGRYLVSVDGGTVPEWSPRGGALFCRSRPAFTEATVRSGPSFEVLRRTVLFSNADSVSDPTHQGYDVAPDGQHFAMVRDLGGSSHLMVTLHLMENLQPGRTGAATAVRQR